MSTKENTEEVVDPGNLLDSYEGLVHGVNEAEMQAETQLRHMIEVLGNTFEHNGQWYQIRVRFNKNRDREVPFLVHLKDNPKTWLSGPRKRTAKTEGAESTPEIQADTEAQIHNPGFLKPSEPGDMPMTGDVEGYDETGDWHDDSILD